jgi:hypothetical protein
LKRKRVRNRFELEAGVLYSQNFEIRGYHQSDASKNWSQIAPTARVEYWRVQERGWNFGFIFQPLYITYKDSLTSDFYSKGKYFAKGDRSTLDYQFPTMRLSANREIYHNDDGSYIRLGGSAILRYVDLTLKGSDQTLRSTNFIALPTLNFEIKYPITENYSFFTRSDFFTRNRWKYTLRWSL